MKTQQAQIALDEIYAPIEAELRQVEQAIPQILRTTNELSGEVIQYFFKAKGKRLRPALCLLGAALKGEVPSSVIRSAAAIEIFHSATLIHDDIVDAADLRRNIPTIHTVWSPQVAVLVGDYLHDRAVSVIFELRNERANRVFLDTAGLVCDGEILELHQKGNFALTENEYFEIIEKKTAALISCCLETSAILAGFTDAEAGALARFGKYFGMAFQIVDDCLDFSGNESEFGKTLGADCAAGVLTLPLFRLLSLSDAARRAEITHAMRSQAYLERFPELLRDLEETGALEYSFRKARDFAEKARPELSVFKSQPARHSLNLLLDYILDRSR